MEATQTNSTIDSNVMDLWADMHERLSVLENDRSASMAMLQKQIEVNTVALGALENKCKKMDKKLSNFLDILKAMDADAAADLMKELKSDILHLKGISQNVLTKFATLTEVSWVAERTHPTYHYKILKKLIASLDEDDSFWDELETMRIADIIKKMEI